MAPFLLLFLLFAPGSPAGLYRERRGDYYYNRYGSSYTGASNWPDDRGSGYLMMPGGWDQRPTTGRWKGKGTWDYGNGGPPIGEWEGMGSWDANLGSFVGDVWKGPPAVLPGSQSAGSAWSQYPSSYNAPGRPQHQGSYGPPPYSGGSLYQMSNSGAGGQSGSNYYGYSGGDYASQWNYGSNAMPGGWSSTGSSTGGHGLSSGGYGGSSGGYGGSSGGYGSSSGGYSSSSGGYGSSSGGYGSSSGGYGSSSGGYGSSSGGYGSSSGGYDQGNRPAIIIGGGHPTGSAWAVGGNDKPGSGSSTSGSYGGSTSGSSQAGYRPGSGGSSSTYPTSTKYPPSSDYGSSAYQRPGDSSSYGDKFPPSSSSSSSSSYGSSVGYSRPSISTHPSPSNCGSSGGYSRPSDPNCVPQGDYQRPGSSSSYAPGAADSSYQRPGSNPPRYPPGSDTSYQRPGGSSSYPSGGESAYQRPGSTGDGYPQSGSWDRNYNKSPTSHPGVAAYVPVQWQRYDPVSGSNGNYGGPSPSRPTYQPPPSAYPVGQTGYPAGTTGYAIPAPGTDPSKNGGVANPYQNPRGFSDNRGSSRYPLRRGEEHSNPFYPKPSGGAGVYTSGDDPTNVNSFVKVSGNGVVTYLNEMYPIRVGEDGGYLPPDKYSPPGGHGYQGRNPNTIDHNGLPSYNSAYPDRKYQDGKYWPMPGKEWAYMHERYPGKGGPYFSSGDRRNDPYPDRPPYHTDPYPSKGPPGNNPYPNKGYAPVRPDDGYRPQGYPNSPDHPSSYPNQQPGYPAPQPGYPHPQPGYPHPQPGYPSQQPGQQPSYPSQKPSQQHGYPNPQPGYPGQQPGYPNTQPGYPGQQPGYPNTQPGYPGQQPGYPNQHPGYPNRPGYPDHRPGYPSQQPGYHGQPGYPDPRPGFFSPTNNDNHRPGDSYHIHGEYGSNNPAGGGDIYSKPGGSPLYPAPYVPYLNQPDDKRPDNSKPDNNGNYFQGTTKSYLYDRKGIDNKDNDPASTEKGTSAASDTATNNSTDVSNESPAEDSETGKPDSDST